MNKLIDRFWPNLDSVSAAQKVVSVYGRVYLVVFILSLVNVVPMFYEFDPWMLLDPIILLVITILVQIKTSRLAAVLGYCIFTYSKIMAFWVEFDHTGAISTESLIGRPLWFILFSVFYVNAIRATFAYHGFLKGSPPKESN